MNALKDALASPNSVLIVHMLDQYILQRGEERSPSARRAHLEIRAAVGHGSSIRPKWH